MSGTRVSLDAFMAELRARIEAFESMWRKERESNPKDWPATQPTMMDWDDQFTAYTESLSNAENL